MAKKEEKAKETTNESGLEKAVDGVLMPSNFDDIEVAQLDESITLDDILMALGATSPAGPDDPSVWEPSLVSSEFFWPALQGLVIRGMLLGVEERQTSLFVDDPENPGKKKQVRSRFYTVELTAPCVAIRSADVVPGKPLPAPVQCQPGHQVSILERTILRRIERDVGREVIIVCDGLGKTKSGLKLWKYRSWRTKKVEVVEQRQLDGAAPAGQLPAHQS